MQVNVGKADRLTRASLGVVMMLVGAYFGSGWGWLGLIPLGTAAVGWCPLYSLFRVNTCRHDKLPAPR